MRQYAHSIAILFGSQFRITQLRKRNSEDLAQIGKALAAERFEGRQMHDRRDFALAYCAMPARRERGQRNHLNYIAGDRCRLVHVTAVGDDHRGVSYSCSPRRHINAMHVEQDITLRDWFFWRTGPE